jgi:hypothetical protein
LSRSIRTKMWPLLFAESLSGSFQEFVCGAPELYAAGPDGFEYRLINEDFVVGR